MKKDILIIDTPYVELTSNNRSNYIPQLLSNNGHTVEKVCSNFNHFTKESVQGIEKNTSYKVTLLDTIAYNKNLSFKRYLSQKVFSIRLNYYLHKRKKPDVIYNFVPSLDVASVVRKYAKRNNVKLIIDVRDLWPEAFKMVIKVPILKDILFLPQTIKANKIYQSADEIVAVSDTYKNRALKLNQKVITGHTIYLGTELKVFDEAVESSVVSASDLRENEDEILLAYVGTLGHSYDLTTTFEALEILKDKGYKNIKLNVLGSGPLENKFRNLAVKHGVNVKFFGRRPYSEMVSILSKCDIALNPISQGAAQSIINKHADYAAAGLPVINTQESKEYRELVSNFKIGINCNNSDPADMANKLEHLINNKEMRVEMGHNHRKIAESKFDRKKTYKKILELL